MKTEGENETEREKLREDVSEREDQSSSRRGLKGSFLPLCLSREQSFPSETASIAPESDEAGTRHPPISSFESLTHTS